MRFLKVNLKLDNKSFIYAQILFVLVMLWFRDVLNFPSAITYVTDVFLVLLLIQTFYKRTEIKIFRDTLPQCIIVALIFLFMCFGAVINLVKPQLVLWGMRNNLRFFIFFFICISNLDLTDVNKFIVIFKKFYVVNLILCAIQYFIFGFKADYLGGIFGTTRGCNGYLNVFICIGCAIFIADYISSKIKIKSLIICLASSLFIAILAELKVFYFELLILIIFSAIFTKPTAKTIILCFVIVTALVLGAVALLLYDASSFYVIFDTDAMELYLSGKGYTSSGDLNRFTAINQISDSFFHRDTLKKLFGFGLGNCEYSQFSFLQSDFFQKYSELNYRWFTHAWVYLEQGFVGLILLVSFFVSLVIYAFKRIATVNRYYMLIAVSFIPTCILSLIYNTSIQVECCYIIALFCAVPFIVEKSKVHGVLENE